MREAASRKEGKRMLGKGEQRSKRVVGGGGGGAMRSQWRKMNKMKEKDWGKVENWRN